MLEVCGCGAAELVERMLSDACDPEFQPCTLRFRRQFINNYTHQVYIGTWKDGPVFPKHCLRLIRDLLEYSLGSGRCWPTNDCEELIAVCIH